MTKPKPKKAATKRKTAQKILVVDDQEMFRKVVGDYLREKNYQVEEASNGQEAVEMAHKKAFDGILMDVRMPTLDGIGALKKLQDMGVKTPVIFMSGFGDFASEQNARSLGAKSFLAKPFKLSAISAALGSFLDAIHLD